MMNYNPFARKFGGAWIAMLVILGTPTFSAAALDSFSYPPCGSVRGEIEQTPCVVSKPSLPDVPPLDDNRGVVTMDGQTLSIVFRGKAESITAYLDPGIPLQPLYEDYWILQLVVPNLSQSKATIRLDVKADGRINSQNLGFSGREYKRGPSLLATLGQRHDMQLSGVAGEIQRQVVVWMPPGIGATDVTHVVYVADGLASIGTLLREHFEGIPPPVAVVAIANCRQERRTADSSCRYQEYVPAELQRGGNLYAFERHERFVLSTVLPSVEGAFFEGRKLRRAVAGVSSGADWALAMAQRHPQIFDTAIAASPPMSGQVSKAAHNVKYYIAAGYFEPVVLQSARGFVRSTTFSAENKPVFFELPYSHGIDIDYRLLQYALGHWLGLR